MELKNIKKTKYYVFFALIIMVCVFFDQLSKVLTDGKYITIINNMLWFESTHNTGAAYGSFAGKTIPLIVLTVVVLSILIFYYFKSKSKNYIFNFAIGFIVGGAIGNLIDRISFGYVRDFVKFSFFNFNCNVADIFLTFGVILFALHLIFFDKSSEAKNGK